MKGFPGVLFDYNVNTSGDIRKHDDGDMNMTSAATARWVPTRRVAFARGLAG